MPSTTTAPETDPSKTVVEEVTGWLRLYSDGTVERLTPPGAEPFTVIVPPYTEPRNGVTVHDVTTARGVDVRLYLPAEPPAAAPRPRRRRPLLLHFHGGGFCLSRPSWALYHNFYAPLAAELDVAGIVSVFLPLAPEYRLPAAIDAGHAALLWLRDVACGDEGNLNPAVERLRDEADFSRVFLIGDSSGGNLVHLVAAHAAAKDDGAGADLHAVRLAGGVLLNPGFAREEKSRSELENPPSFEMPSTTTAPETDPSKTVVEEITGWLRLYSDGTVERLTPLGAEPFTVIVPPYTEPRNGVTVHDVTTARGVDARLYLPAEPATAHRPRRRPLLLHFHGGVHRGLFTTTSTPLLPRSSTSPASSPSSSHLRPSTASLPPLTLAMVDKLLALGVPLGMNKDSPYTSPSLVAEAVARLHMPPMLLVVAEKDLLHDPQVEYGEAMARVGKTVETVVSRGAVAHVFYLNFFALPPMLVMVAEEDMLRDAQMEYGEAMARAGKAVETVVSRGRGIGHVFYLNWFAVESDPVAAARARELVDAVKSFVDSH
uniref:Alpha/beta hydrolase fold-3 domain-containing protein n=1 Tax=Oryza barthii TaxID=65489 RepID=A0A0D3HHY5_9ORYZ